MTDIVERLRTAVTYGYMPRRMREVADEAADHIEALEAQLAARNAEIAVWLRSLPRWENLSPPLVRAWSPGDLATAIETGAYRRTTDD